MFIAALAVFALGFISGSVVNETVPQVEKATQEVLHIEEQK